VLWSAQHHLFMHRNPRTYSLACVAMLHLCYMW